MLFGKFSVIRSGSGETCVADARTIWYWSLTLDGKIFLKKNKIISFIIKIVVYLSYTKQQFYV
jgi:hypothetical protein